MNKFDAKNHLCSYLNMNNISFIEDFDNGVTRITMLYKGCNNCPDKVLESCIWFYENEMEIRIYYDTNASNWCRKSDHISNLMRLFNYINTSIWSRTSSGMDYALSRVRHLYTPRLYMTEDGFNDITLTSIIAYDFYAVALLETEEYITTHCPKLLNQLAPVIFGTLLGRLKLNQAIDYIDKYFLNDMNEKRRLS